MIFYITELHYSTAGGRMQEKNGENLFKNFFRNYSLHTTGQVI